MRTTQSATQTVSVKRITKMRIVNEETSYVVHGELGPYTRYINHKLVRFYEGKDDHNDLSKLLSEVVPSLRSKLLVAEKQYWTDVYNLDTEIEKAEDLFYEQMHVHKSKPFLQRLFSAAPKEMEFDDVDTSYRDLLEEMINTSDEIQKELTRTARTPSLFSFRDERRLVDALIHEMNNIHATD